ncbi:hypothetical protein K505DRAFT_334623 [Melanomma pulvis-pyrius CBS 109.77]|uniref:Uncharacterized protein n=1 Tax=Melanomma pulvis-pyrius CBS 109.77 TaxID=1314802 RepID=A0A6A6XKS8_9PLEO|nr:hypothetical protein K505DRAFT_334623 [Melanomma pulvis-pyrius CBS 109.77]
MDTKSKKGAENFLDTSEASNTSPSEEFGPRNYTFTNISLYLDREPSEANPIVSPPYATARPMLVSPKTMPYSHFRPRSPTYFPTIPGLSYNPTSLGHNVNPTSQEYRPSLGNSPASTAHQVASPIHGPASPKYPQRPPYVPYTASIIPGSPTYGPYSLVYVPQSPVYAPRSPIYVPDSPYTPKSPTQTFNNPKYPPTSLAPGTGSYVAPAIPGHRAFLSESAPTGPNDKPTRPRSFLRTSLSKPSTPGAPESYH